MLRSAALWLRQSRPARARGNANSSRRHSHRVSRAPSRFLDKECCCVHLALAPWRLDDGPAFASRAPAAADFRAPRHGRGDVSLCRPSGSGSRASSSGARACQSRGRPGGRRLERPSQTGMQTLRRIATDAVLRRSLQSPSDATRDAARAHLTSLTALGTTGPRRIELWNVAGISAPGGYLHSREAGPGRGTGRPAGGHESTSRGFQSAPVRGQPRLHRLSGRDRRRTRFDR